MNTTLSPDFGVGITCPLAGSLWGISAVRYLTSRSFTISSSVTEEAVHLPWELDLDITKGLVAMKEIETWALELEVGKAEEEVGVGEKDMPIPLYKGDEYRTPPRGR